jgi:UDP-N-acetylglucosamine--N-acetylmuramyl-(pentapeptide) pyrophosphoryl-undecaprenol N-acetylglucosamine transferase
MRVLIVTGSSGGHIFPALALAESLKSRSNELLLVLPKKSQGNSITIEFVDVKYIYAATLGFKLNSKNIVGLFCFLAGAWEGLLIILKFKPDVVVGFGSLNTIALIFWAWLFRIKTIIHEQNVIPGRANCLLAKLVDKVAVSFSQTNNYLNVADEKIVLTGNLVRNSLIKINRKQALDFFKFKEGKFNILITGGSQGSAKLNSVCLQALAAFQNKEKLQIVHIVGSGDSALLKTKYDAANLDYRLFEFSSQMQYAYSFADLIICRSGASTVAELAKFRVAAILVPYPFAYAHQLANAKILEDIGAAEVLLDADLTFQKLNDKLQTYCFNDEKLKKMQEAYQKILVLDAATNLANAVLTLK